MPYMMYMMHIIENVRRRVAMNCCNKTVVRTLKYIDRRLSKKAIEKKLSLHRETNQTADFIQHSKLLELNFIKFITILKRMDNCPSSQVKLNIIGNVEWCLRLYVVEILVQITIYSFCRTILFDAMYKHLLNQFQNVSILFKSKPVSYFSRVKNG